MADLQSVGASGIRYKDSEKYDEWCKLVTDKSNRLTFGNSTQAAMVAYGYDKNDPKQYKNATQQGWYNYRKFKDIARAYMEAQGITFGVVYDSILSKMAKSQNPLWTGIVAEILGMTDVAEKIRKATPIPDGRPGPHVNYTFINNGNRRQIIEGANLGRYNQEQLAQVLIEGGVRGGDGEETPASVHSEALSGEHSED